MKSFAVAASIVLAAGSPAFAGSIALGSLQTLGDASKASGALVLTPNNTGKAAGAGYIDNALALGSGANFDETFTFSIAQPTNGSAAGNGFAFFLATTPTGIAASNMMLGLTANAVFGVEFYDFPNSTLNPTTGGVVDSNLVAAIQNGNTNVKGNAPGSYGSAGLPGNPQASCVGAQTSGNGCMSNGDVWTADISYIAGKLTVTVEDGALGAVTVISNYAIALGGNLYAGFSGSTGNAEQSVSILGWSQSVPEPMTIGMFGAGLAALGMVRRRRAV